MTTTVPSLQNLSTAKKLNCFISVDPSLFPENPAAVPGPEEFGKEQPLTHVPFVAKDIVDTGGLFPTTAGTPTLHNSRPKSVAPVIAALQKAGAVLYGTTNLHELSFGITSNNAHTGPVRNPVAPERSAGGSSGGTAVAVALGLAQFGIAADTGGSARLPAAFCGIYGFRPTHGRYDSAGVVPISPTRDTLGLMADSISTIATVDAVITGEAAWDTDEFADLQGLRIGVASDVFGQAFDPVVAEAFTQARHALARAGIELVEVDVSAAQEITTEISMPLCLAEFPQALQEYLDAAGTGLTVSEVAEQVASRDVRAVLDVALAYEHNTEQDHAQLAARRSEGQKAYAQALVEADVEFLIYPTSPAQAPEIAADGTTEHLGQRVDAFTLHTAHAHLAGCLGFPAASIQVASTGLPVGIDVAGGFNQDRRVLALADRMSALLLS
ncbi:amidase family protein [Micrococcoides hystricis]|uniref:Amidase family protein n=1 Tax=Micrococcoides hystricis TaxID=1572761 RepID=A0ABV6PD09_9MICC